MRFASMGLLILAATAPASDEMPKGTPAKNKIVAVTVYLGNALVVREVTVPEGPGMMELVVSPLPPRTLPGSPYAEGTDGIRILNTRFRSVAIKEDAREEVRKLEGEIRTMTRDIQRLKGELKLASDLTQFLGKLEGFTAVTMQSLTDKGQLSSEAVIGISKFVMLSRTEKARETLALEQKIQDLTEAVAFAKRQLEERSAGVSRTERVAVITIDKAAAPAGTIKLFYLVDSANWRPQYRFRAGKANEPVGVEYLAAVQQQTGEDWSNVALALSTAQPLLNAAPPELRTLEVSAVPVENAKQSATLPPGANAYGELKKRAEQGRAQGQSFQNSANFVDAAKVLNEAAACEQQGELLASKDEILAANRDAGSAAGEGPSVTYRLRGALSLPSRNDEQTLEVTRLQLAPDFYFKAVPVLTPHVYRAADLVNKSEYVLFPGEATMYQGQDFVGRMALPLVAVGKTFSVSFGVDPQLNVQRTLVNKNRATSGGNQVHTFDYRLLLNSYKNEPVRVQVWDRLPKGEASTISVNLVSQKPDLSADPLYLREDRPRNLLRWDVVVQPAQNGEKALAIEYSYRMELDKQLGIGSVTAK
jgi:uncharacterized protein (TIGR02231 family)